MDRAYWQGVTRDLDTALRALHHGRPVPLPVYARLRAGVRDSARITARRMTSEPFELD